jgi:hypothetical protein
LVTVEGVEVDGVEADDGVEVDGVVVPVLVLVVPVVLGVLLEPKRFSNSLRTSSSLHIVTSDGVLEDGVEDEGGVLEDGVEDEDGVLEDEPVDVLVEDPLRVETMSPTTDRACWACASASGSEPTELRSVLIWLSADETSDPLRTSLSCRALATATV